MRRLVLLVLVCGLISGCSGGKAGPQKPIVAPVDHVILRVGRTPTQPAVVVDQRGYTLYVSTHERAGHPTCTGSCLQVWPLLLVHPGGSVQTGSPLLARAAVTTVPVIGGQAVAYHGYLLHTYVGDATKGGYAGQGIGKQWSTITPAGRPTI